MIQEIKFIQNIGRFARANSESHASFGKCTLIFGENGWGKSTLADVLRSFSTESPEIMIGRKTLPNEGPQKVILQISGQTASFESGQWSKPAPQIAIYDSVFINNNVYSGDIVNSDHLKSQYGLVVGDVGVKLVRQIVDLDNVNNNINREIRAASDELGVAIRGILGTRMVSLEDFLNLEERPEIENEIVAKKIDLERVQKTKELKAAAEPKFFPTPTNAHAFSRIFDEDIDGIAESALNSVRSHVLKFSRDNADGIAFENWLEKGTSFSNSEECQYCGQVLTNRSLVDAYKNFFGDSYKKLSLNVERLRETLARYISGEFNQTINALHEQNTNLFEYWKEAADLNPPKIVDVKDIIKHMESTAAKVDELLKLKQSNLTDAISSEIYSAILGEWDDGKNFLEENNKKLGAFLEQIKEVKENLDISLLSTLEEELQNLRLTKRRYDEDIITSANKFQNASKRKEEIRLKKDELRKALTDHGRTITTTLGTAINSYLRRLNAGFRIDYKEPNYRGKEPAASYQILINETPVSPSNSGSSVNQPSFRNTLSAGDKSTLALALFLAKINADSDIQNLIVLLDDPFTSLDSFRRQFTAMEIRKLCEKTKQTIVLSHDKGFLRLLWDKIDHAKIKSLALQTGAPGITTIAPFDIVSTTQPRYLTERMKIEEFVEGEEHDSTYIRTRLRTVCEDFYRKGDPSLFGEAASLEQIIRKLESAPDDHPYKGAIEDLKDINEYSRGDNHAEIQNNPYEETSNEELKGFCIRVLGLTRGM